MASILVPVLYLAIVVGGLLIFSSYYRKRLAAKRLAPWFPSHPERDTYVTLLQQTNPPASDALLKAALIRRAMADVVRFTRIREDKAALQALLQKGSIGDDLWNSFLTAEKETQAEILEVMHEANTFVQGWGQLIFTSAGEMVQNEKMKGTFDNIPKVKAAQEAKYSKSRKTIAALAKDSSVATTSPAAPTPVATEKLLQPTVATSPSTNGLAPSQNADADSLSDGELVSMPTTPPQSAKPTPSKSSSSKKGKKRK